MHQGSGERIPGGTLSVGAVIPIIPRLMRGVGHVLKRRERLRWRRRLNELYR